MKLSKLEITFNFIINFIHAVRPLLDKIIIFTGLYYIAKLLLQYDNDKIRTLLNSTANIFNKNFSTTIFLTTTIIASVAAWICIKSKKNLISDKSDIEKRYLAGDKYCPSSNINKDGTTPK